MAQRTGWGLFRTRNILGAVLVVGMIAGTYLADFWKGFGFGFSGSSGGTSESTAAKATATTSGSGSASSVAQTSSTDEAGDVIKVVIANWSYSLRTPEGEKPVELARIVELAKAAQGDDDGIRVRIYRKLSSRVQAEQDLEKALIAAGINDKQMVFMPTPVEDK